MAALATGFATATVKLGTYCPTNAAGARGHLVHEGEHRSGTTLLRYTGTAAVTNCAAPPAGVTERNRFRYLTTDKIFKGYSPPVAGSGNLGTLGVHLPVDVNPSDAKQAYVLKDDIVLRNTPRQ